MTNIMKRSRTVREEMLLKVVPSPDDLTASCRNKGWCEPAKCFYRVSLSRSLYEIDPEGGGSHHPRIDAGHAKFNYKGYRWKADTPKAVKRIMITLYDRLRKEKNEEVRAKIIAQILSEMKPFTIRAVRGTKIIPVSRERQDQINAARRERIASGGDEHKRRYAKMRKRIEGYSATL